MHKRLLVLGLLRSGPMHGYELGRIVAAHGELYRDLKRPNMYYLLTRLADDGLVTVQAQPGSRGRRGERLVYELTAAGRDEFDRLLRHTILTYEPTHTGIDASVVFLASLPPRQAVDLLRQRRRTIAERRDQVRAELGDLDQAGPFNQIAADHLLGLIDAELAWLDRSLRRLTRTRPGARARTTGHRSAGGTAS